MMKNTIFLLLVIFGLFACEDDDSVFEPSTQVYSGCGRSNDALQVTEQ